MASCQPIVRDTLKRKRDTKCSVQKKMFEMFWLLIEKIAFMLNLNNVGCVCGVRCTVRPSIVCWFVKGCVCAGHGFVFSVACISLSLSLSVTFHFIFSIQTVTKNSYKFCSNILSSGWFSICVLFFRSFVFSRISIGVDSVRALVTI